MRARIRHQFFEITDMWKLLYQLASPRTFYHFSAKFHKGLTVAAAIILPVALLWGLFIAPPDYQQGDAYRIMFVHVPSAFLSMALYGWMSFLAVLLQVWRIKIAGLLLIEAAKIGAGMTLLALITGSIWGRPMWGSWWVWDARLTSELILLFLYIAIISSYKLFEHQEAGMRMAAILTLVGFVDLPIIHYSVYWWNTLHQGASLSVFSTPKIAMPMLFPLLLSILGFLLYCFCLIFQNARTALLLKEKRQSWVKALMIGVHRE